MVESLLLDACGADGHQLFNYTDRVAVAVFIEPIKRALLFSDT